MGVQSVVRIKSPETAKVLLADEQWALGAGDTQGMRFKKFPFSILCLASLLDYLLCETLQHFTRK